MNISIVLSEFLLFGCVCQANEIAFINCLEAQNKRHEIMSKHQESEARLQDIQVRRAEILVLDWFYVLAALHTWSAFTEIIVITGRWYNQKSLREHFSAQICYQYL